MGLTGAGDIALQCARCPSCQFYARSFQLYKLIKANSAACILLRVPWLRLNVYRSFSVPCSATCTMSPFCDAMDQTAHAIADLHTCNAVPKHCRTKPGVVTLQAAHYLGSPLCWHVPARNPFLLLQWPRHFNVQTTKQRYWYCIFLCRTYVRPGCWIQTICCVHVTLAGLPVASKASQSRYCAHKGNCFLPLRILCIPRYSEAPSRKSGSRIDTESRSCLTVGLLEAASQCAGLAAWSIAGSEDASLEELRLPHPCPTGVTTCDHLNELAAPQLEYHSASHHSGHLLAPGCVG